MKWAIYSTKEGAERARLWYAMGEREDKRWTIREEDGMFVLYFDAKGWLDG